MKKLLNILFLSSVLILTACAGKNPQNPEDPYESFNRKMYAFNKWFDIHFFRPVAVTYTLIIPAPARNSVTNFFNNVDEIPTIINTVLQGEGEQFDNSVKRLVINSTIGIAGLFDPATRMGHIRNPADLGETFYRWGWTNSNYVFIPLLGPSTSRDGTGLIGSLYLTPWPYLHDAIEWSAVGLMGINLRAKLLESEGLMGTASLDEYLFVRDAYLQHRNVYLNGQGSKDTWTEDNEEWLFDNASSPSPTETYGAP